MVMPPTCSATPIAMPRCSSQTMPGSATAAFANGHECKSTSTSSPRCCSVGSKPPCAVDFHERCAGIALGMICRVAPSRSATDVNGRLTGADHLRQQRRDPLVRTGHTPAALGRRIHRVQEPGSAPSRRGGTLLNDKIGGHELGEVLAHSVVVELEPIGQLTHAHGRGGLDDVTEDGVTGGIAAWEDRSSGLRCRGDAASHCQRTARRGACRKRPNRAEHGSSAAPGGAGTAAARSGADGRWN